MDLECKEEIAVLLATYNGEKYLAEQIDSLLNQTFQNWRLFAHDDGSTDKTALILKEYAENYPEKIVLVDTPPTGGPKSNFLFLLKSVDAPYIMFCDQDDIWLPKKIERTYQRMKEIEGDKPALVFTDLQVVDQDGILIAPRRSEYQKLDLKKNRVQDFLAENVVTGCTVMINRALAEMARKLADPSKIIMHDWCLAILAARFGVVSCLDEPLIQYRQHGVNSIGAKGFKSYVREMLARNRDIPASLEATRVQAKFISDVFSMDTEDVITQYGNLSEESKPERLFFYARNRIRKSGLARNIGLSLWG